MRHEPLRQARKAANITLPRMAEIIGMDRGNLSRVENGHAQRTKVREVAMLYDLALGNEPYTLVRECGDLPATLTEAPNGAIPGWLSSLTTNLDSRLSRLLPFPASVFSRPLPVATV